MAVDSPPRGLGGWLILLGLIIGVILAQELVNLRGSVATMFADGGWDALTTPGSLDYHPGLAALIVANMVASALLAVGWVFALYLFFTCRRLFRRVFIAMLLLPWVVFLVTVLVGYAVAPWLEIWDLQTTDAMIRDATFASFLIPYVLYSRRVAATFVRPLRQWPESTERVRGAGSAASAVRH